MDGILSIGAAEIERLAWVREYYESGCLCIRDGKLSREPSGVPDARAIALYERGCNCSRHPDWPSNLTVEP